MDQKEKQVLVSIPWLITQWQRGLPYPLRNKLRVLSTAHGEYTTCQLAMAKSSG